MVIPAGWGALGFTSGRRTYLGNKRVGGVSNSDHLLGHAADFTAPYAQVQAMFPHNRILDEGDHRHVSGLSDVPYFGTNGTAGLVNGVDTSAPKGATMLRPRKPAPVQQPMALNDAPLGFMGAPSPISQMNPQIAELPQPVLKPQGHGKQTLGAILGILGDSLAAYGGQRGVYAPFMLDQQHQAAEDNRFQQQLAAQQGLALQKAQIAAMAPPKPTQTDRYVQEVLDPNTPQPRRQLLMQILTRPLMTVGADGSQTAQYGAPPDQGDEWEYNN